MKMPANILATIKGSSLSHKQCADVPFSRVGFELCGKLREKNYIGDFYVTFAKTKDGKGYKRIIKINLVYDLFGENAFRGRMVIRSSSGRRNYVNHHFLYKKEKNKDYLVLTPSGFKWVENLKNGNYGGEFICELA